MTDSAVVMGSGQANRLGGSVIEQVANSGNDDFNTFNDVPDDQLNKPAEDAGEVADTDNYRGLNENSIIQELEEVMANTDTTIPSDLQEEVDVAMEALRQVPLLREYQERITKRGIGIPDVVSIESHFPGMLTKNAPISFSYRPSQANAEYSQEAIGEKIGKAVQGGRIALAKLAKWIREQCKKIRNVFTKERFKKAQMKVKQVEESARNPMRIPAVLEKLGNTDEYDKHPIVLKIGEILDMGVTLEMFSSIRVPGHGPHWVRHISQFVGPKAKPMIDGETSKAVLSKLMMLMKETERHSNDFGTNRALGARAQDENIVSEWVGATDSSLKQGGLLKVYNDAMSGELVTDIIREIVQMENIIGKLERRDSEEDRSSGDDKKDLGSDAKDMLELMNEVVGVYRDSLSSSIALLSWTAFSVNFIEAKTVEQVLAKRQSNESAA